MENYDDDGDDDDVDDGDEMTMTVTIMPVIKEKEKKSFCRHFVICGNILRNGKKLHRNFLFYFYLNLFTSR